MDQKIISIGLTLKVFFMKKRILSTPISLLAVFTIVLTSCNFNPSSLDQQPTLGTENTATPFQPVSPTSVLAIPTDEPVQIFNVSVSASVPQKIVAEIEKVPNIKMSDENLSNLKFGVVSSEAESESNWILAVVAPFYTISDEISLQDLHEAWNGHADEVFTNGSVWMTEQTKNTLSELWGESSGARVKTAPEDEILAKTNETKGFAIIPFESINPGWKVLRIGGISPVQKEFDVQAYPLTVHFGWMGNEEIIRSIRNNEDTFISKTNRDPEKFSVVVLTGTTALTRAIAAKMELNGMTYPAKDIRDWLLNADITHISNEVSFSDSCPNADQYQQSLSFCGQPRYAELLQYVGTDVVELTGNHLADFGKDPLVQTMQQYTDIGMQYYAAGMDITAARQPIFIEDHGNRFAFIGCNAAGPDSVFATDTQPGVATCDGEYLVTKIGELKSQGYLPIVTFQWGESYQFAPMTWEVKDAHNMIDAGAVIVSGSQSHIPMSMELYSGSFIHYGLGNLFFDQMDIPVVGTRREFIDRHYFYDGKYLGVELLTALLEDYSKPRPMTETERIALLSDAFVDSK